MLKANDASGEVLARLVNYAGQETGASSLGIFQNRLGGRVAVAGYFPWSFLHNLSKTAQMKSLMRWLSHDRLPAYVASFHKANVWVRPFENGKRSVVVLNASFDPAEGLDVALNTSFVVARVYNMRGQEEAAIRAGAADGPYRHFVLPPIEPWSMRLLVCEAPAKVAER